LFGHNPLVNGVKMAEKSISEKIVDDFLKKITNQEILDKERLEKLKTVLNSDQPKKVDILKAIKEEEDENP
jgi:hypothetical protein